MSKGSKVVLIFVLALMVALFVMLFMGLGDSPVIAPRSPL